MTMKYAKEGYPEPVPGVLVFWTSVADLAIRVETCDDGVFVEYLSVNVVSGKSYFNECRYRAALDGTILYGFPLFDPFVLSPPTGAGEGQQ
jgi:hypothetical protein